MLGYLMEPKERLRVLKTGMANNTPDWTARTVELPEVETMLTRIDAKDAEVETVRQLLSLRSTEA